MKRLPDVAGPDAAGPVGAARQLLFALFGGPAALTAFMVAGLALSRVRCDTPAMVARIALVLATFAVTAAAFAVARRHRRRFAERPVRAADAAWGRDEFLAVAALATSGASVLFALYFAAVVLFLEPCWYA